MVSEPLCSRETAGVVRDVDTVSSQDVIGVADDVVVHCEGEPRGQLLVRAPMGLSVETTWAWISGGTSARHGLVVDLLQRNAAHANSTRLWPP